MKHLFRNLFIFSLFALCLLTALVLVLRNGSYYALPETERPFHLRYEELKPSGIESHGYGVVGSLLLISGVALYSTRKRFRRFSDIGKIKYFLEVHIFLCLLGPTLIIFHTTMKFGGLVGVSFWSMSAVVLSGIVGRYLYVQIPKGIKGNELTSAELAAENQKLYDILHSDFHVDDALIQRIDALAIPPKPVGQMHAGEIFRFFVLDDLTRKRRLKQILTGVRSQTGGKHLSNAIGHAAAQRITLMRRTAFLEQLRSIFHYWHVVHLPFTIILFAILAVHVLVAVALGYTWIW
jgi:hypothetical protein